MSVRMSMGDSTPRTSMRASPAGSMLDKVATFFGSSKNLTADGGQGGQGAAAEGQAAEERGLAMMSPAISFVAEEVSELKQAKSFTRGKSFTGGEDSVKMDALVAEAEKTAEASDGGL